MMQWKHGALVALAAGSLLASACKKQEEAKPAPAGEAVKAAEPGASAPSATATPAPAGEQMAKVHCLGVNSCKGTGACKTASNACAGQNGCKGQGMTELAEADCTAKGGTVAAK